MSQASALTPLPVVLPLLGAAVLAALRKVLSRAAADTLGTAVATATLVVAATLLLRSTHGAEVYWFGNWHPRGSMVLGITFVVEPISAGLATLAALLTTLALLFSWRFVDSGGNHLQPLLLLFLAAMCGFSLTGDLFNMFVFFELMSTAAFALCGLKTKESAPLQGSFNFAVTNTVAAFFVLTGIALLYSITGALNMAQIGFEIAGRHDPLVLFAFTLLTCGFLVKAAIVPFHLWLPDAHAVAPTPICVLFSGLMVELGLYAVLRLHTVLFAQALAPHAAQLRAILLTFAAATVFLGGIMCYAEHHLKRMLAFSTICHAGMMLAALSLGGPLAVAAMLTYVLGHAFVKSSLFFTSGMILHRLRSISENALFRRGVGMHGTAALWFLGGAGLAAAPGFATMLAEAGVSRAEEQAGLHGVSLLYLFGGVLTSAAVFRVGMHTFLGWGDQPLTDSAAEVGELPETAPEEQRLAWWLVLPPTLCVAASLALSLLPGWLPVLRDAAAALVNQPAYLHTVYTGQSVRLTQPSWSEAVPAAMLRGSLALALALLLALSSVFRSRLPRALRIGPRLEGKLNGLRAWQSGHPGDYVLWITAGVTVFGAAALALLRS
ncbi:MAG: complex I subunit 5 family protein [Acidobacteriota bacterium]|nr:complex I subunit 5 family protein [Acidobacteriota bacterium]